MVWFYHVHLMWGVTCSHSGTLTQMKGSLKATITTAKLQNLCCVLHFESFSLYAVWPAIILPLATISTMEEDKVNFCLPKTIVVNMKVEEIGGVRT